MLSWSANSNQRLRMSQNQPIHVGLLKPLSLSRAWVWIGVWVARTSPVTRKETSEVTTRTIHLCRRQTMSEVWKTRKHWGNLHEKIPRITAWLSVQMLVHGWRTFFCDLGRHLGFGKTWENRCITMICSRLAVTQMLKQSTSHAESTQVLYEGSHGDFDSWLTHRICSRKKKKRKKNISR